MNTNERSTTRQSGSYTQECLETLCSPQTFIFLHNSRRYENCSSLCMCGACTHVWVSIWGQRRAMGTLFCFAWPVSLRKVSHWPLESGWQSSTAATPLSPIPQWFYVGHGGLDSYLQSLQEYWDDSLVHDFSQTILILKMLQECDVANTEK